MVFIRIQRNAAHSTINQLILHIIYNSYYQYFYFCKFPEREQPLTKKILQTKGIFRRLES